MFNCRNQPLFKRVLTATVFTLPPPATRNTKKYIKSIFDALVINQQKTMIPRDGNKTR